MNIIILEGPDGGGKSTFAAELEKFNYKRQNFSVPPAAIQNNEEKLFRFFLDPLLEAHDAGGRHVFDRLHLSERIYAPLMRGGTGMTYRAEALIERYLESIDAQVVLCLPPRRIAFRNWLARRGSEYVKDAKIYQKVYDGYVDLMFNEKRNRHFIWYDYTRYQFPSLVRNLRELHGLPLNKDMVGSQRPRFLIVGEQANTMPVDLPFMSTRNCSGWLFDALREAGYQEHELAFVNAVHGEITNPVEKALRRLGIVNMIALGQVAGAACRACCPGTYYQVAHPQHAKRFKSQERAAYVAQLKNIRRNAR